MDKDLVRMAKYYSGDPKQKEALEWLQSQIPDDAIAKALLLYRQAPNTVQLVPPGVATEEAQTDIQSDPTILEWSNFNTKLSANFSVGEVLCYDPNRVPREDSIKRNIFKIVGELQKMRDYYSNYRNEDTPFKITSGYRPPEVNRRVGGARQSRHIFGTALDIAPLKGDPKAFEKWIDRNWSGGVGYGFSSNKGFTHIDINLGADRGFSPGVKSGRRWNY